VVGTETLIGREMREVLAATSLGEDLRLVAAEEKGIGTLTEKGGEAAFLIKLTPASLQDARAIILAGPSDISDDVIELKPAAPLIDLTYAAEEQPQARLRAPMLESPNLPLPKDAIHVVAHPAAIAIALVLGRLHGVFPIRRAVVQIFEPASERGSAGIEELQNQTVSLLSLKSMPKEVFDNQLSFTLLAQLGEAAVVKLQDVEARIERHLASLLAVISQSGTQAPMPSLRLVQAPVFHGYSLSFWIELDKNPGVAAIEQALSERFVEVRSRDTEPPNNVGVAGQNEIMVGAISVDRNQPNAFWMWMAVDNLRLTAQNAAMVVRDLI
jgi:aspartate-semialdehyde dehydrogenase